MIFDKEQWPLSVSYGGPDLYAGVVSPFVSVCNGDTGKVLYRVRVVPPTAFFPFAAQLVGLTALAAEGGKVKFFLEDWGDVWSFGFSARGDMYDLWPYKELPVWAEKRFKVTK
jgi:hypothetical protein